jgi:hypothetical protein
LNNKIPIFPSSIPIFAQKIFGTGKPDRSAPSGCGSVTAISDTVVTQALLRCRAVVAGETHHVGPPFNGKTIGKTIGKLGFHGISWGLWLIYES